MLQAAQGNYHDGIVELDKKPDGVVNGRVVVTFLDGGAVRHPNVPVNSAKRIDALRAWLLTLPDVPPVSLDSLDREQLYP